MTRPDVAIVGAGPAGAWAAFLLATAGARVTVFDGSHPREKPCGGGLTARTLDLISHAVPPSAFGGIAITRARFESGDRRIVRAVVSFAQPGRAARPSLVVVNRATFDRALLDAAIAAGATLVPARVLDVQIDDRAVHVRTDAGFDHAAFLIGADGVTSLVRRRLSASFDRSQLSMAAGFYVRGPSSDEVAIRWVGRPQGYLWAFPRQDGMAAGMGAQADESTSSSLQSRVAAWLEESGISTSSDSRPYAWPIPSLTPDGIDRERPAGDRWLLVGDAAGLVDPLTREGVYYALQSAVLAVSALGQTRSTVENCYVAAVRRGIFPELRRAARLKSGFFTTGFTDLLVHALGESAAVRAIMVDLISGRQPYGSLRSRLLTTFDVGLAWRLLRLNRVSRSGAR